MPNAKLAGHNEGTVSWMAFSDRCSPSSITFASSPVPVFIKKCFCKPFSAVVVILAVVEKPDPPCAATWVVEGLSLRVRIIAGSIFMMIVNSMLIVPGSISQEKNVKEVMEFVCVHDVNSCRGLSRIKRA